MSPFPAPPSQPVPPTMPGGPTHYDGTLVYVANPGGAYLLSAPQATASSLTWLPANAVVISYATTTGGYLYVTYGNMAGYVEIWSVSLYDPTVPLQP